VTDVDPVLADVLTLYGYKVSLGLTGLYEYRESLERRYLIVLPNRVRDVVEILELNVSATLVTVGTLVPEEVDGDDSTGFLFEELTEIVLLDLLG
jgi:hypothetical protein